MLFDITHPLTPSLAVWPGDTPVSIERLLRLSEGDTVNLGTLCLSLHAGSHADAPLHFRDDDAAIGDLELAPYLGPALVADVSGREVIGVADVQHLDLRGAPRLLLRTGAWPDCTRFPEAIPVLEPAAIEWLGDCGVLLLGLDVPSVDALDSKELPNHHALFRRGIRILESLRLDDVPAGRYELIALPLRLSGADGSPVRAVLRSLP